MSFRHSCDFCLNWQNFITKLATSTPLNDISRIQSSQFAFLSFLNQYQKSYQMNMKLESSTDFNFTSSIAEELSRYDMHTIQYGVMYSVEGVKKAPWALNR
jgi:hypothetical protein